MCLGRGRRLELVGDVVRGVSRLCGSTGRAGPRRSTSSRPRNCTVTGSRCGSRAIPGILAVVHISERVRKRGGMKRRRIPALTALASVVAIATVAVAKRVPAPRRRVQDSQAGLSRGGRPGVVIDPILSVSDTIGEYQMSGIPDGLGAYESDLGDQNKDDDKADVTVVMNHELGRSFPNRPPGVDTRITRLEIDPNTHEVHDAEYLFEGDEGFERFCSSTPDHRRQAVLLHGRRGRADRGPTARTRARRQLDRDGSGDRCGSRRRTSATSTRTSYRSSSRNGSSSPLRTTSGWDRVVPLRVHRRRFRPRNSRTGRGSARLEVGQPGQEHERGGAKGRVDPGALRADHTGGERELDSLEGGVGRPRRVRVRTPRGHRASARHQGPDVHRRHGQGGCRPADPSGPGLPVRHRSA